MTKKFRRLGLLAVMAALCGVPTLSAETLTIPELRAAAEKGSADAQYELSLCYSLGCCVKKDPAMGKKWCLAAAAKGHKAARCVAVLEGYSPGNREKALEALRKAAESGDAWAQFSLATYSADRDPSETFRWLRKAAERGHAWAQIFMAMGCFGIIKGGPQDPEQGFRWASKAAEQGHPMGQYFLGGCYAGGQGVAPDRDKAVYWIRKAAERGFEPAQEAMKRIKP